MDLVKKECLRGAESEPMSGRPMAVSAAQFCEVSQGGVRKCLLSEGSVGEELGS